MYRPVELGLPGTWLSMVSRDDPLSKAPPKWKCEVNVNSTSLDICDPLKLGCALDSGKKMIDCGCRGIHGVFNNFDLTEFGEYETLLLNGNDIQSLQKGAFQNKGSSYKLQLRKVDLTSNSISMVRISVNVRMSRARSCRITTYCTITLAYKEACHKVSIFTET